MLDVGGGAAKDGAIDFPAGAVSAPIPSTLADAEPTDGLNPAGELASPSPGLQHH